MHFWILKWYLFGLIGEGDVLKDVRSGGVVEVDSAAAVDWCRSVWRMCVVGVFFVFVVIGV